MKRVIAIATVAIATIALGAGARAYAKIGHQASLNLVAKVHTQQLKDLRTHVQAYHLIGQVQSIHAGRADGWQSRPVSTKPLFKAAPAPHVDYLVSDSGPAVFSAHYPFVDAAVCVWSVTTLWYSGLDGITVGGKELPIQSDADPYAASSACGLPGNIVSVTFTGTVNR